MRWIAASVPHSDTDENTHSTFLAKGSLSPVFRTTDVRRPDNQAPRGPFRDFGKCATEQARGRFCQSLSSAEGRPLQSEAFDN